MIDVNLILLIGGVLMVFFGIPFVFWGIVTKFSFYREREIDDRLIYIEAYEFIGGWRILRVKQHPKALSKASNKFRSNPLNKRIWNN